MSAREKFSEKIKRLEESLKQKYGAKIYPLGVTGAVSLFIVVYVIAAVGLYYSDMAKYQRQDKSVDWQLLLRDGLLVAGITSLVIFVGIYVYVYFL